MAAQAQLISSPLTLPPSALPPPPHHLPTQDQWGSRPVDPSDKEEGGRTRRGRGVTSQEGGGGGGAAPEQRRRQSRERSHRQQKGTFLLSRHPLSHKVTDSERSLLE